MLPLDAENPAVDSPYCLFSTSSPEEMRVPLADAVDQRAWQILNRNRQPAAPDVPAISISAPPVNEPTRTTPLLRLLYIHISLRPASSTAHLVPVLIPVYTTLLNNTEEMDLANVEADAFWLFEEILSEFADLWMDETSDKWLQKLGDLLRWADPELATALVSIQSVHVSTNSRLGPAWARATATSLFSVRVSMNSRLY